MSHHQKVLEVVEELPDDETDKYDELDFDEIKHVSEKSALFEVKGEDVWVPLNQLRQVDGDLYATKWILKQRGLD